MFSLLLIFFFFLLGGPLKGVPISTVIQLQRNHSAHVLLVQIERTQQDRVF